MVKTYLADLPQIESKPFPEELYAPIGKLVRAFAEVEGFMIDGLAGLLDVNQDHIKMMIGFQGISKLRDLLEYISKGIGGDCEKSYAYLFEQIREPKLVRDYAAHGTYLGYDKKVDVYHFLSSRLVSPVDGLIKYEGIGFSVGAIKVAAATMDALLPHVPDLLRLEASPRKRADPRADHHPKSPHGGQKKTSSQPSPRPKRD